MPKSTSKPNLEERIKNTEAALQFRAQNIARLQQQMAEENAEGLRLEGELRALQSMQKKEPN